MQLERRPDFPGNMRGSLRSYRNLRGTQTFPPQLNKHHEIPTQCELRPNSPAVTREESGNPTCTLKGDLTSLRQDERLPEVSVATRVELQTSSLNLRKSTRFHSQCEIRSLSPAAPQEQSRVPSLNSKGALTPVMQFKRFPEISITTQEESRISPLISRRGLIPLL